MFPKKYWKSNKQESETPVDTLINRSNRRSMPRRLSQERVDQLISTLEKRVEDSRKKNAFAKKSRRRNVAK